MTSWFSDGSESEQRDTERHYRARMHLLPSHVLRDMLKTQRATTSGIKETLVNRCIALRLAPDVELVDELAETGELNSGDEGGHDNANAEDTKDICEDTRIPRTPEDTEDNANAEDTEDTRDVKEDAPEPHAKKAKFDEAYWENEFYKAGLFDDIQWRVQTSEDQAVAVALELVAKPTCKHFVVGWTRSPVWRHHDCEGHNGMVPHSSAWDTMIVLFQGEGSRCGAFETALISLFAGHPKCANIRPGGEQVEAGIPSFVYMVTVEQLL